MSKRTRKTRIIIYGAKHIKNKMFKEKKRIIYLFEKMQSIPVYTKELLYSVRQETYQLLSLCKFNPGSPMIRPYVHVHSSDSTVKTPMLLPDDWSILIYLPRKQSFFVTSKGALIYNFNTKVKVCNTDSMDYACRVWKGTVLGVEKTLTDWYAVDAYVIAGNNLMHLPFSERKHQLVKLRDTCIPSMHLVESLPNPKDVRVFPDVPLL